MYNKNLAYFSLTPIILIFTMLFLSACDVDNKNKSVSLEDEFIMLENLIDENQEKVLSAIEECNSNIEDISSQIDAIAYPISSIDDIVYLISNIQDDLDKIKHKLEIEED